MGEFHNIANLAQELTVWLQVWYKMDSTPRVVLDVVVPVVDVVVEIVVVVGVLAVLVNVLVVVAVVIVCEVVLLEVAVFV